MVHNIRKISLLISIQPSSTLSKKVVYIFPCTIPDLKLEVQTVYEVNCTSLMWNSSMFELFTIKELSLFLCCLEMCSGRRLKQKLAFKNQVQVFLNAHLSAGQRVHCSEAFCAM